MTHVHMEYVGPQPQPADAEGHSTFNTSQVLRIELIVRLGENIAQTECAIQLIEGWRTKSSISGGGKRKMLGDNFKQRESRTERQLMAISKWSHSSSAWTEGNRERVAGSLVILPLVDSGARREDPSMRKMQSVLSKVAAYELPPAGKRMSGRPAVGVDNFIADTAHLLYLSPGNQRLQLANIA